MKRYSLCILALVLAGSLAAQTFRGSVKGTVEDPSGAALAGAKVTATNSGTGVSRATLSGAAGDFSVPDLPPGKYTVSALKEGFTEQKSEAEIEVSRVASINFRLPLASQASSVAVSAAVETVETSSTTLTGVVDQKTVSDLPMNGRDFRQMIKLTPGVSVATTSINGSRTRGNNYMIDGADNNDGF